MKDKTFAGLFIVVLVIAILIGIIGLQADSWAKLNSTIEAEANELEINQSWDEGWYDGYEWGYNDLFTETMRNGFFVLNETWVLYSPEGCATLFMAELGNRGCEVVCP